MDTNQNRYPDGRFAPGAHAEVGEIDLSTPPPTFAGRVNGRLVALDGPAADRVWAEARAQFDSQVEAGQLDPHAELDGVLGCFDNALDLEAAGELGPDADQRGVDTFLAAAVAQDRLPAGLDSNTAAIAANLRQAFPDGASAVYSVGMSDEGAPRYCLTQVLDGESSEIEWPVGFDEDETYDELVEAAEAGAGGTEWLNRGDWLSLGDTARLDLATGEWTSTRLQ